MMPVRFRLRVLTLTAGAAALMAPLPGFAASAQAATAGGGGHGPASAPGRAPSHSDSMTFAGYQATVAAGSATSSAAHFKVPALSCTSAFRGITPVAGVEVGGGSSYSAAFLFTGCRGGKAVYFPAVVVNGRETNYTAAPFHAGNVVAVATKVTTKGTTVSVTDTTTGVTKKRTGPGASPSAAYVGDSDWVSNGTVLGVPNFGTLTFTNCSVDGKALARSHPARYQRVSGSVLQIATGALASAGTAFPTHYKHA